MKSVYFVVILSCLQASPSLYSQEPVVGVYPGAQAERGARPIPNAEGQPQNSEVVEQALPSALRAIRERQAALAREQGVGIRWVDEGMRSVSSIVGVPSDIESEQITSEGTLREVGKKLHLYFGFSGSEAFVPTPIRGTPTPGRVYSFRQFINEIPTEFLISITLDENLVVRRIRGVAAINRGFATEPRLSEEEAIQSVLTFLEEAGGSWGELPEEPETKLWYREWGEDRALVPWWIIDDFFVDPAGGVSSTITVTP